MPSFQLSTGVVVNTDRGEAYVMSPDGGTDAVDLAEGALAWHSSEMSKPLTLADELLVGQGEVADAPETLRIVTLDTAHSGEQVNEALVALPPGVQPTLAASPHRSFTAEARGEPDATVIDWEFVEQVARGLPPGPAEVLPGEAPPATSAAATPAAMPGLPTPQASPSSVPEAGGETVVVRGTARLDPVSGAVTSTEESSTQAPPGAASGLVGDTPQAPDIQLPDTLPNVPEPQFLSADGRHVMSSERVADDPEWNKYTWRLFERDSGQPVGEVPMHVRYVPFFVDGSRVIYQTPPYERREGRSMREEPLQLRATDLSTGAEVWTQPVRDTTDREPPPP